MNIKGDDEISALDYKLSITAESGASANGIDKNSATATLSRDGELLIGENLLFIITGHAKFTDGTQVLSAQTNVTGRYTAYFTNTVEESVTITVILNKDASVMDQAISVFGHTAQQYPAPSLREANLGQINPDSISTGTVHVDISPYENMKDGDVIVLNWMGILADGNSGPVTRPSHIVTLSDVGNMISFSVNVTNYLVPYNNGGVLTLGYSVNNINSLTTDVVVGNSVGDILPPPIIEEAIDGILDLDEIDEVVTLTVPVYPEMATGDLLTYFWKGIKADGTPGVILHDGLHVPASMVGRQISFTLYSASAVVPYDNGQVEVWYQVETNNSERTSLHQTYSVGEPLGLPAPIVIEAVEGDIDPANIIDYAHIHIRYPELHGGDVLQALWQGYDKEGNAGSLYNPALHVVTNSEAALGYVEARIPRTQITTYLDGRALVSYELTRYSGTSTITSDITIYNIRSQVSSGDLWVVGGRTPVAYDFGPGQQALAALNKSTRGYLNARWQYEGENSSIEGERFTDISPEKTLIVSVGNQIERLRPANVIGTAHETYSYNAITARLDDHSVVAWGYSGAGGTVPGAISTLRDIVSVNATWKAFAAIRQDKSVVAWGESGYGGVVSSAVASLRDITKLAATGAAFAVLRADGSIAAWGNTSQGGNASSVSQLRNAIKLASTRYAFAALTSDGSVVAWGDVNYGGSVPGAINVLRDITRLNSTHAAFAALRLDGSVVTWGYSSYGGNSSAVSHLRDITHIQGTQSAFAALRQDGSVAAWGDTNYGGSVPAAISSLRDIVCLASTRYAFAALRTDGSVVAWGYGPYGASVPETIRNLRDIISLSATAYAFCGLRADGSVVAWGYANYGGDYSKVTGLRDIRSVTSSATSFSALGNDGTVSVWGAAPSGTQSNVPTGVAGYISYAQPLQKKIIS